MCVQSKLQTNTLYSSVNLVDCFFSENYLVVGRFQLLCAACLLIAWKYEELGELRPPIQSFCLDTEEACRKEQIIDMEKQVFKCVGRHLVDPTTNTFLRMFLVVARASTKLQCMSSFLAELSLMSQKFVPYLPSKVAASALFLARWTLDPTRHPWDESLQKFTTYESCELKNIVFYLQALQQQIEGNVCTTIRNKYSEPKFQNVAALSSKDLDDTMF
ncbi:unnamed protein product [Trifolium pratense]|uniref:Uncharacterized protein n=1 Tax=Trifolium pratense TaxID=57577 RepID=A0ACB0KVS9_TRIPR|nr:unnamed protein product [Trifolium pratense]